MRSSVVVLTLVVALIGGATYYGMNRKSAAGPEHPDVSQKLMLAGKFVEQGDGDKALEVLSALVKDGYDIGQEGEMMHLRALEGAGMHEEAALAAADFIQRFPRSSARPDAEVIHLTSSMRGDGLANPALRKSVETFLENNPDHPGSMRLQAALARQDLDRQDVASARRRLEKVLSGNDIDDTSFEVARVLGEANLQQLWSTALGEGDLVYEVKKGDFLSRIAANHGITVELLMRCNNITNPKTLRVGQKLKVPNVKFSLEVDIAANTMMLRNHGQFFKLYRVRTGRERGATPTGTFKVLNKKTDPTWRPGNGYEYGPGDPNNELGTRWMAFEGDILGIHGTLHPDTIGEYASNGCVGMLERDVQELFDLIIVGTTLSIKGEQDFTRHRVIPPPTVAPPVQVASTRR
jgi:LysM repeat protein